jgi:hypothetical protein
MVTKPERAVWHGFITHVPDGTRFYLKDFGDIVSFIQPYFPEMSADTPGVGIRPSAKSTRRRTNGARVEGAHAMENRTGRGFPRRPHPSLFSGKEERRPTQTA